MGKERLRFGPRKRIPVGTTDAGERVVLSPELRQYSLHVMGAPGQGKSKFMEWLIRHDIANGEGLCLLDPHGELYNEVVTWCAATRRFRDREILLFDLSAPGWRFGFNPLNLENATTGQAEDAIAGMVRAISQLWGGVDMQHTPRLARRLPAVLHALWANGLTLREAAEVCSKSDLQMALTRGLEHEGFRSEWAEFNAEPQRDFVSNLESTRNRLAPFFVDSDLATMTGLGQVSIDFRRAIEEGAVVLVNLAGLSEAKKRMIGMLLVNDIYTKGIQREPNTGKPFHLYLDECYYFLNEDVERILFELRKFRVWVTMAHHTLSQLRKAGDTVHDAVLQIPNKALFGGLLYEDAKRMVMSVFLGELNLEEAKRTLDKPVVVGHRRERFQNHSDTESSSSSTTTGESESLGEVSTYSEDMELRSLAESIASIAISSETESYSSSSTDGWSEGLVPILEERHSSVHSLDEVVYKALVTLVNKPKQHAVVKLAGQSSAHVKTPTVKPVGITKKYVERMKQKTFARVPFAVEETRAHELIAERRQRLLEEESPVEPEKFRG